MNFYVKNWRSKLGSFLVALTLYAYLQDSKMLTRTINIPIDYPVLESGMEYDTLQRTIPVRMKGKRDLVNYYAQFMKVSLVRHKYTPGMNEVSVKKVEGVPTGIRVTLLQKTVSINVESFVTKKVLLEAAFKDELAPGMAIGNYTIRPAYVNITGRRSILEKIKKIRLNPVSLDKKEKSFTARVKIAHQKGIDIDYNGDVKVRVNLVTSIDEAGLKTIEGIPVQCSGLDEKLESRLEGEEVSVQYFSARPVKSIDVLKGIKAYLTCNYTYDLDTDKILPSDKPVYLKVKINKAENLQDIEIKKITPMRIRVEFDKKPEKQPEINDTSEDNNIRVEEEAED